MVPAVLFFVLLCACLVGWLRMRARNACEHALPPPHPGKLPIIGHIHRLVTDTVNLTNLVKSTAMESLKYGGVSYFKLGKISYIISDPEDALTVANGCLDKHFLYGFARNWVGDGLVTSSGRIWYGHRKLLNPAFTTPVIHSFLEVFNSRARVLVKQFDDHVGEGEFNTWPYFGHFSLGIACLTGFGMKDLHEDFFFTKYMEAIDGLMHISTQRFLKVWLHYEYIYKLLGWQKKEDQLVKTLNELSDLVIQKYKETLNDEKSDIRFKPLVGLLLGETGEGSLSDQEIKEEINTAVVAGYETMSSTLAFTLTLLGSYPEVQEKVYQEFTQLVGADGDVDKHDIQKLVYTDAVIKEVSRLIPTGPVVARYVDKDIKLKNYTLRAGSDCFLMLYGMLRHPSWGPDVEQFRPERWLDPSSLPANPNAFAAFGLGKRSCIGKTYAMVSLKVALAHLVRKYRWTADYTKLQCKIDISMKPVTGHEIKLQLRR